MSSVKLMKAELKKLFKLLKTGCTILLFNKTKVTILDDPGLHDSPDVVLVSQGRLVNLLVTTVQQTFWLTCVSSQ